MICSNDPLLQIFSFFNVHQLIKIKTVCHLWHSKINFEKEQKFKKFYGNQNATDVFINAMKPLVQAEMAMLAMLQPTFNPNKEFVFHKNGWMASTRADEENPSFALIKATVFEVTCDQKPGEVPFAIMRYLIFKGVNLQRSTYSFPYYSSSPLHKAAYHHHIRLIEFLLKKKVDPNQLDSLSISPVDVADMQASYRKEIALAALKSAGGKPGFSQSCTIL